MDEAGPPMDEAEARAVLQPALDWTAHYLATVATLPVAARTAPGDVIAALPEAPPVHPEDLAAVLADLDRIVLPAMTHWNHPRFMGFFGCTGSLPGIAGELLSAAFNINAMLWRTAPAATEVEMVAIHWLAQLLGLPAWFGLINDTASASTLTALTAARHGLDPDLRRRGWAGAPPMAVYASTQAHSSVDKAVATLGLGTDHLRRISTDAQYRMDPAALTAAVAADVAAGIRPMAVVATVGTTATTSIDPLPAIAETCERYGIWLHVDAAYGGAAAALPELAWILAGAERADSLVVNPHKWLFVPFDCSVLYLREPSRTRQAFSVVPDYLASSDETANLMDYGISLGRRFRGLKLWMVLRCLGTQAITTAIREHIRLAHLLASWVAQEPGFALAAPVPLSVVNLRYQPPGVAPAGLDALQEALVAAVNASGEAYVSTARIDGRQAVHVAVGNLATTEVDVTALWALLRRLAPALAPGLV